MDNDDDDNDYQPRYLQIPVYYRPQVPQDPPQILLPPSVHHQHPQQQHQYYQQQQFMPIQQFHPFQQTFYFPHPQQLQYYQHGQYYQNYPIYPASYQYNQPIQHLYNYYYPQPQTFQHRQHYGAIPPALPQIPSRRQPRPLAIQQPPPAAARPPTSAQPSQSQPTQIRRQPPNNIQPLAANNPAVFVQLPNQVFSFKEQRLINLPQSSRNLINNFVYVPGRLYAEELILNAEIDDYIKYCPVASYYFDYTYLCRRTLEDLPTLSIQRFLHAIPYEGKGGTKYRHLNHLDEITKIIALQDLLFNKDGIIVLLNNTFSSEHLAFNHEGGVIEFLYDQLTNDERGQFPGMELNNAGNKFVAGAGQHKCRPRKFVQPLERMKLYGLQTAFRSYLCFKEQQHFVITKDNYEEVVKAAKSHRIADVFDNDDAFSRHNLVNKDFSFSLNAFLEDNQSDEDLYNRVWTETFANVIPQNCFVFIVLNGKNVPNVTIAKDKNYKYNNQTAVNDDFGNGFDLQGYLDAVVAVGIENDFTRLYGKMLKSEKNQGDPVKDEIKALLQQDTGIFLQTVFSMSSENECLLRKAAMKVSMDQKFDSSNKTIDKAKIISAGVIENAKELEEYGSICCKKSFNMFLAQLPSRLTKEVVQRDATKR